ncbi:hypothetical protein [Rhizobium leguminosarum]|uniref:hypothetical protein n=1 Tax=Rhizobium leguminosarum TaxID=384 RepID=UPI003B587A11
MGTHPSSLSRALNAKAMSAEMAQAAEDFLNKPIPHTPTVEDHERALHILQKFLTMVPELEAAVQILLDANRPLK